MSQTTPQPVETIGAKPVASFPGWVKTPLGEGLVRESITFRDGEFGFEVEGLSVTLPLGRAKVAIAIGGRTGQPIPDHLPVTLSGGGEGEAAGDPATLASGGKVAWTAWLHLDLLSGMPTGPDPVRVDLFEHAPPPERMILGIMAPGVKDPETSARIAAEVGALAKQWAAKDRGWAARVHAALLRHVVAEMDADVERARRRLADTLRERDAALDLMRRSADAEAGRGRPARQAAGPDEDAPEIVAELRGHPGAAGMDAEDLDEILVTLPESLHLEMMSETSLWMGVYFTDGRRLSVRAAVEAGKLKVGAEIDDDGER